MLRFRFVPLLCLGLASWILPRVSAQETPLALTNAHIISVSGVVIEQGVLVVQRG